MNPLEWLERVGTPDGKELALLQRGGIYFIKIDGYDLMSSRAHGSEDALARLACRDLNWAEPRVLIGGLGMGYTLRAALDQLPRGARVTVAEVFSEVIRWNRELLGHLAGRPLDDPRATVAQGDVLDQLEPAAYDVIMLDVDNGPDALVLEQNRRLYSAAGLVRLRRALRSGGRLAVWSADPDPQFLRRMRRAGFQCRCEAVRALGNSGPQHTIFIGQKLASPPRSADEATSP